MPNYIFSYRFAKGQDPMADPTSKPAWGQYLSETLASNIVDPGWPVFRPSSVLGDAGPATQIGGYSIVKADSLDDAIELAKSCPAISRAGGVEVGELAELPPEHAAEVMRSNLASA